MVVMVVVVSVAVAVSVRWKIGVGRLVETIHLGVCLPPLRR